MDVRTPSRTALLLLAIAVAGCAGDTAPGVSERGPDIVAACSGHDGVAAFDDDAVICADQTARGERAAKAVDACRGHGGAVAFDDDIVICRDETIREAPGG